MSGWHFFFLFLLLCFLLGKTTFRRRVCFSPSFSLNESVTVSHTFTINIPVSHEKFTTLFSLSSFLCTPFLHSVHTLSLFHIPSLFSLSSLLFPSGFRSHAHSLLALFLCQWHLNPLLLRCFSSTPARGFPHEAAFFSLNLFFILQHILSHSHFPSRILPCIV